MQTETKTKNALFSSKHKNLNIKFSNSFEFSVSALLKQDGMICMFCICTASTNQANEKNNKIKLR